VVPILKRACDPRDCSKGLTPSVMADAALEIARNNGEV
jgi:hypothetical protein